MTTKTLYMKRNYLLLLSITGFFICNLKAQEPATATPSVPTTDFDKKWRFGLRITPQPCWFSIDGKNQTPGGVVMGLGFGLNMEYRFSPVAGLLTGIGGDFEGGKYKVKSDASISENYVPTYYRDADEFVKPNSESPSRKRYLLQDRTIKTTHVTIPFILKLSTQEYGGIKYFGMCGVELGVRVKATGTDSHYTVSRFDAKGDPEVISVNSKETDINMRAETTKVPLRFGVNGGLGGEYRLGGTTAFFCSLNFFYSLTNVMKRTSDYTYFRIESGNYRYVEQKIKMLAVRINLGIMF
jgi:hypothetical protein